MTRVSNTAWSMPNSGRSTPSLTALTHWRTGRSGFSGRSVIYFHSLPVVSQQACRVLWTMSAPLVPLTSSV